MNIASNIRHNSEKKEFAARKFAIKSKSDHLKDAQHVFNAYIRTRDYNLPCISCGRFHDGKWDAGHYLAVSSHPELRFNDLNTHKQCQPCNRHLSGNQIEFRRGLILKVGVEEVEKLEGPHKPIKLYIDEILEVKRIYRLKLKEIKNMM